ncbi:MAG: hypothetical protein ACR2PG_14750 [Hyphomicrobiaceae bacterium]
MPAMQDLQVSIVLALIIAALMVAALIFILFYHDTKHDEIDRWIDFSFTGSSLRQALAYYHFMAISILFFYVAFTCSCLLLQADGFPIFSNGDETVWGGPISVALFCLDLVLRGGFFDVMEHFELRVGTLTINTNLVWFWIYTFVFRLFYGLTLIKILISFAWIYGKMRLARQAHRQTVGQTRMLE